MRTFYSIAAISDLKGKLLNLIDRLKCVNFDPSSIKAYTGEFNGYIATIQAMKADCNSDYLVGKTGACKAKKEILTEIDELSVNVLRLLRKILVKDVLKITNMQGTFDFFVKIYRELHPTLTHSSLQRIRIESVASEVIDFVSQQYTLDISERVFPGYLILGMNSNPAKLSLKTVAEQADLSMPDDDYVIVDLVD